MEKEISILAASVQVHKDKLDSAERELTELRNRYESEKKRTTEVCHSILVPFDVPSSLTRTHLSQLRTQLQERESAAEKLRADIRNLEDEWTRSKKELGRAKAAGLHSSGNTSSKELQLQSEIDKLMVSIPESRGGIGIDGSAVVFVCSNCFAVRPVSKSSRLMY